jgi:hypothetical protein
MTVITDKWCDPMIIADLNPRPSRASSSPTTCVPCCFLLIAIKRLSFAVVLTKTALPPIDTPNGLGRADPNERGNVISQDPAKHLVCLEVNAEYLCNI